MGRAISEKKVAKDSKKGPKLDEEAAKKNKLLPKYALAAEVFLQLTLMKMESLSMWAIKVVPLSF